MTTDRTNSTIETLIDSLALPDFGITPSHDRYTLEIGTFPVWQSEAAFYIAQVFLFADYTSPAQALRACTAARDETLKSGTFIRWLETKKLERSTTGFFGLTATVGHYQKQGRCGYIIVKDYRLNKQYRFNVNKFGVWGAYITAAKKRYRIENKRPSINTIIERYNAYFLPHWGAAFANHGFNPARGTPYKRNLY